MSKKKNTHSSKKVSKKSSAKRASRSERKKPAELGSSLSPMSSLSPPVHSIADELAYEEAETGSLPPEERPLGGSPDCRPTSEGEDSEESCRFMGHSSPESRLNADRVDSATVETVSSKKISVSKIDSKNSE